MTEHLKIWTVQRFVYGVIGGILIPALLLALNSYLTPFWILIWAWGMVVGSIAAEIMERYVFFRSVIPLKMPH